MSELRTQDSEERDGVGMYPLTIGKYQSHLRLDGQNYLSTGVWPSGLNLVSSSVEGQKMQVPRREVSGISTFRTLNPEMDTHRRSLVAPRIANCPSDLPTRSDPRPPNQVHVKSDGFDVATLRSCTPSQKTGGENTIRYATPSNLGPRPGRSIPL